MLPCCRSGEGYCAFYHQFMPAPLQALCAGRGISEEEQESLRKQWDDQGGPLATRRGLPTVPGATLPAGPALCRHLGEFTGELCGH